MKKSLFVLVVTASILMGENVNIINSCDSIDIIKVEIDKKVPYGNIKVISYQYGFKNKTDKKIDKVKMTVYLKDKDGNRIFDDSFSKHDIKPHYEVPFEDGSYYSVSPIPSSYGGSVDVEFKCNTHTVTNAKNKNIKNESEKNNNKFVEVKIPKKVYDKLKTVSSNILEEKLNILVGIAAVVESGGGKQLMDKLEKCDK